MTLDTIWLRSSWTLLEFQVGPDLAVAANLPGQVTSALILLGGGGELMRMEVSPKRKKAERFTWQQWLRRLPKYKRPRRVN